MANEQLLYTQKKVPKTFWTPSLGRGLNFQSLIVLQKSKHYSGFADRLRITGCLRSMTSLRLLPGRESKNT
jgi:hypothetical protein